jgi:predicted DNA-binding transcriptional regulator AlpA
MTRFLTRLRRPWLPVIDGECGRHLVAAGLVMGMSTTPGEQQAPRLDRTPMWTLEELCAFVRTTPATVHTWRKRGTGPRAYKIGRHLLFAEADVAAWLAACAAAAESDIDNEPSGEHGSAGNGSGW